MLTLGLLEQPLRIRARDASCPYAQRGPVAGPSLGAGAASETKGIDLMKGIALGFGIPILFLVTMAIASGERGPAH